MTRFALGLLVAALIAPLATTQSTLPANTFVVVTTHGLFVPDPASTTPHLHIPTSSFPGAGPTLEHPAIEWHRASDSFLVGGGPKLWQVKILDLAAGTFTIDDVTPAGPVDIHDLDVHPGSGELFVLEQVNNEAWGFAPPFALDMQPVIALPIPATSRSLAVDSRLHPVTVVVTETGGVTRVKSDGVVKSLSPFLGGRGIDVNPQPAPATQTLVVSPNGNDVVLTMGTGLGSGGVAPVIDMNRLGFCIPLAISPQDVEWNPNTNRAYVLAGDGLNQNFGCQQTLPALGPNHVLSMPTSQAPPNIVPKLRTFQDDSGITGISGDLTLVLDDFGFLAPLGESCVGGSAASMKIKTPAQPVVDDNPFALETSGAPENAPLFLILGFSPGGPLMAGQCSLAVSPDFVRLVGSTDAEGMSTLVFPKPPDAVIGYDAFVQTAALQADGSVRLSHGLQVHFGQ